LNSDRKDLILAIVAEIALPDFKQPCTLSDGVVAPHLLEQAASKIKTKAVFTAKKFFIFMHYLFFYSLI